MTDANRLEQIDKYKLILENQKAQGDQGIIDTVSIKPTSQPLFFFGEHLY